MTQPPADAPIFNPVEHEACGGDGCDLCHGDGELCGSCKEPVSACACDEGEVTFTACQTNATTPEAQAALLGIVQAAAKRVRRSGR